MRKTEQCPKCESHFIGILDGAIGAKLADGSRGLLSLPAKIYICSECGFFEQYLETAHADQDMETVWKLKLRWLREPLPPEGPYR